MIWIIILALIFGAVLGYKIKKERRSFVTGSYAYGDNYRTASSDIDLVLWLDKKTFKELEPFCEKVHSDAAPNDNYHLTVTAGRIKAGHVDLLLVHKKSHYDHWRRITEALRKEANKKAISRKEAINAFEKDKKKLSDVLAGQSKHSNIPPVKVPSPHKEFQCK